MLGPSATCAPPSPPTTTSAPSAKRIQPTPARAEGAPAIIQIDDRACCDRSFDVGPHSPLDYPFTIPHTPNHVLFRRYLLRHITRQQGEVYPALRQIAYASTIGPITLRPGYPDAASIARADVIRRAVVYMLNNELA